MKVVFVLVLAAVILTAAAWQRAPEYDEAYSIFLTAGDARPAWPTGVFTPAEVRGLYEGRAGFGQIAQDLRKGDVHPPLYFWALELWRRAFGPSWFVARLLSVVFSLGALAALAWLAGMAGAPVVPAMLIALLSYGFAYTGIVARGFALAQMLNVVGVACLFAACKNQKATLALCGGLALGAASFSNYLSCFAGIAVLVWLGLNRWRVLPPALLGFVLFLPADTWFFMAQRHSRANQFDHFSLTHALILLAKDSGAALFGGLPVYAGSAGPLVGTALLLLLAVCGFYILKHRTVETTLFALGAVAPPLGLLALGVLFNKTPIEIRYLAFSMPFVALLMAQALRRWHLTLLLAVELLGLIGLAVAPATMQSQAAAAHQAARLATPQSLVLLPFGNDGVGVPGPFIEVAPDNLRIILVSAGVVPNLIGESRVIIATVNGDQASKVSNVEVSNILGASGCWRRISANQLTQVYVRICANALRIN